MRKSYLYLILTLSIARLGTASSQGQNPYFPTGESHWKEKIYDTAFVRIQYTMTFWDQWHFQRNNDLRIVEIGPTYRKDYSTRLDELERKKKNSVAQGIPPYFSLDSTVYPFEWFMEKTNKTWCTFRTMYAGPILRYDEELPHFQWQLFSDLDTIAGFLCQQAYTDYKGRRYEAWYCPDIPLDAGSYKFNGLPGLILKIQDTSHMYSWEISGLEKGQWPITEKQHVFQQSSREKARELIVFMFAHPFRFLVDVLHMNLMIQDGKGGYYQPGEREFGISWYYDPIERE